MHEASSSHLGSARSCSPMMSSTLLIPLSPPTTSRQRSHTSQPHGPAEDVLASAVWIRQGSGSCSPCSRQPQDPAAARGVEQSHSSGDAAADLHNFRHAAAPGIESMPRLQLDKVAAAGQGAAASSCDSSAALSSSPGTCQGSSGDACSDSGSSSCYNSVDSQSMQSDLSPPPAQRERRAAGSADSSRDEAEVTSDKASRLQLTVAEPQLVGPRPAQAAQGSLEGHSEGGPGLQELELLGAGQELAAGPEVERAAAVVEGVAAVASQAEAPAASSRRRQGTPAAPMQQPVGHHLDAPAARADAEGGCTAVTASTAGMQPSDARSEFSGVDAEATQPASPRQIVTQSGSPRLMPPASHKVKVLWAPVAC